MSKVYDLLIIHCPVLLFKAHLNYLCHKFIMSSLFNPYKPFKIKNRSVMAPMTRYASDIFGNPSKKLQDYYIRRAKNDIGLIIVESASVNDSTALGYSFGLQFHNEKHSICWKNVVNKVHENGSKIILQLFHPGRLTVSELTNGKVLAPSAIKPLNASSFWRPEIDGKVVHFQTLTPYPTPIEMSIDETLSIIDDFANAAKLAMETGFDGVEIHGAHGYLIHQFCHKSTNKRTDDYSATTFKFAKDIVANIKSVISSDAILSFRLSQHMIDNSYIRFSKDKFNIKGLVKELDLLGVDVFHCSEIKANSPLFGAKESLIEVIRSATTKPIIACGKIADLKTVNELLSIDQVDFVAFGRLLINNPKLIYLLQHKPQAIKPFDYESDIEVIY